MESSNSSDTEVYFMEKCPILISSFSFLVIILFWESLFPHKNGINIQLINKQT